MARKYIGQLGQQESVDEVYRVSDKQLRPNRNGNLYLQFDLSDRTGRMAARMWNASEALYRAFENGDYLRVEGVTQVFQGAMQMIVARIEKVEPSTVAADDFAPVNTVQVDKLLVRLGEILRGLNDPALQTLAECFLLDEPLMGRFAEAPAGIKNHHAYRGGLLEHVVNIMEAALRLAPCYPQLNSDLLVMGAFLHDMGKTGELLWEREMAYSDEGQLIGHIVMGVEILDRKLAEAEKLSGEPVPVDTALRLKHMLLSHHGEYEYGSPKLPMTLEAIALYFLDNLDAKINAFGQLLRDDPNVESAWTVFHPQLNRKLYKGTAKPA